MSILFITSVVFIFASFNAFGNYIVNEMYRELYGEMTIAL